MTAPTARPYLLVGLTGGIATGKSTVAAMFRALGCEVIDADQLAREVVEPGEPALEEIVAEFGPGILQADGRLDRGALGALVFGDPVRRRRLEAITHPRIRQRLAQRLAALAAAGFRGVVIFDAPLLVETGAAAMMDRLVVVVADEATQLARLMARDGLSREQARERLRSQLPLAEKVRHAHYVIDNSGDLAVTAARVREVYQALLADLECRPGAP